MENPNPNDISNVIDAINLGGLLTAAMIIAITWAISRIVHNTLTNLGERFVDKRLLLQQTSTLVQFGIYLGGISLAFFASFDISEQTFLALTGTLAVTVGFALKDLASSVLAGVIIIIDRPFRVGDRVSFEDTYGEITSIGLRSVRLVTLDDSVVTIPNNKFLNESVSSGNWGALDMLVQIDFLVAADTDIDQARTIVVNSLVASRYVYTQKPWTVLVNQHATDHYVAIRLRAKAYVVDVKYEKAFESDVSQRVLEAFQKQGIHAPT